MRMKADLLRILEQKIRKGLHSWMAPMRGGAAWGRPAWTWCVRKRNTGLHAAEVDTLCLQPEAVLRARKCN